MSRASLWTMLATLRVPAVGSPEALESWINADIDRYRRIIETTGAKPDGR